MNTFLNRELYGFKVKKLALYATTALAIYSVIKH